MPGGEKKSNFWGEKWVFGGGTMSKRRGEKWYFCGEDVLFLGREVVFLGEKKWSVVKEKRYAGEQMSHSGE